MSLMRVWLLVGWAVVANGQFPGVCVQNASISKICCQTPPGFTDICAGPSRGVCADIPVHYDVMLNYSTQFLSLNDERFVWPIKFFTKTCYCLGNFYGPGCQHCKLGFYGSDCNLRNQLIRVEYRKQSPQRRQIYQNALNASQTTLTGYEILKSYQMRSAAEVKNLVFSSTTWYGLWAWHLSYAADRRIVSSDSNLSVNPDTAGNGSGFATWRRYFLLWIERVMQQLANDTNLFIPYWDWTADYSCAICSRSAAGNIKAGFLPSKYDVDLCLSKPFYDPTPASRQNESFRACLEGLDQRVRVVLGWNSAEQAMREPAFLNHLAFLDKIFAEWYNRRRPPPTEFPEQMTAPGQSLYSYMIPFLPMATHASMLTATENLGYVYE
uniref:Tyrosinase copper-binding domain-containing protein n=1 Tax=Plectus sambesii TaxID=2011161 RepID=A0A914VGJ7_9BILA